MYRKRHITVFYPVLLAITGVVSLPLEGSERHPSLAALIHRSVPPPGAQIHTVVLGERFRAGSLKKWLYGNDYRHFWLTPIEVQVLDLDAVGGGLNPKRTGGFGQSVSLQFRGEDGLPYMVRSIDKDPTKRLWEELKNSVVEDVLQDQISALFPTGALVVEALMDRLGILHTKQTLVVIPDHPRLGKFRKNFAGLIGALQLHPDDGPDDTPGFAGSRAVESTEGPWENLAKGPEHRVDAREFLRARLLDILINDKD